MFYVQNYFYAAVTHLFTKIKIAQKRLNLFLRCYEKYLAILYSIKSLSFTP